MTYKEAIATAERTFDGPWYRFTADSFTMQFLISADEAPDTVCNVDAELRLADDSRWSATVFTLDEVARLMNVWSTTGEALAGAYFWCSDGLIVREAGVESMALVLAELLDTGEYTGALQRLNDTPDPPRSGSARLV